MRQFLDVADLLVKYNLTAVSVVDDNNKLLGIISEGDLLSQKVTSLMYLTHVKCIRC